MPTDLIPRPSDEAPLTPLPPRAEFENPVEGSPKWKRYLVASWRARWFVLAVTALGTGAGVAAAHFTKLTYRAQATLWIEVSDPRGNARGPIRTEELLQSYGWIELLRSFTVLHHTVHERRLFVRPVRPRDARVLSDFAVADRYRPGSYRLTVDSAGGHYRLATSDGAELESGPVGQPVGRKLGFDWTPPVRELTPARVIDFEIDNIRDRANAIGDQLNTQMIEGSNFLRVSLAGADPQETAATLRSLTERYVEVAAQLKRQKLDELTGVLAEQRRYAEATLRNAEADLEAFRIHTITLPSDQAAAVAPGIELTRDPVLNAFFDLQVQREQIRNDRLAIEEILAQVADSTLTVEALAAVPAVQQSASLSTALQESATKHTELRGLLQRYTELNGSVLKLRSEIRTLERETIPRLVAQLRDQLMARERLYDSRIEIASRELRQIPPRAIEEARLQRRVAIASNLNETLQQRYEEARLAAASSIPDIRILDPATASSTPESDRRPLLILLSIFGGFGLAIVGVVARELTDSRVRYPEQVIHEIGLPVLGTVPHVGASDAEEDTAHVLEAFREMRLGVVHAHGAAGPITLTITSPESGDGKSLIAANLAVAFAQRGDRTLVIDGDIRRGKLHHLLGMSRTPGLTDFLAGEVHLAGLIQRGTRPNLWFIGSGTRMPTGPEMLGTSTFGALLATLRSKFDVILVDSAPMGAGADAYVLSTLTRDVLIVLRTGTTDREFTEGKLRAMDRLPIRILGAVLNDFVPSRLYRYYSYLPGYTAVREEDEQLAGTGTPEQRA